MRRALAAALALLAAPAAGEPAFRDLTEALPVAHVYDGDWAFYVGGGVAVFDCDDDGYLDLYAAGGAGPARLFVNRTARAGAPPAFGLADAPEAALTDVTGAYPLDLDGDGRLDLFVLRSGPNAVLRGLGGCRFERAEAALGIAPGDGWSTAFAAAWGPGDERPTLAVGNYVDRDDPAGPFGTCDTHQLFRPEADGYGTPEIIAPGHCTLAMLFTDWSGRGTPDLWISNDRHYYVRDGQEQLFRVWPRLAEWRAEEGWERQMLWGMGLAARDITGDARPEIAVTSMADQKLYELQGDGAAPRFASIAFARGTTAHRPHTGDEGRPSTGWHVEFGDVDNNGRDDLFIAKGNVNQMPDMAEFDPDNLLMQQPDGRFVERASVAGVASGARGRGAALADLNRDGRLDLVVVQRRAPMKLHENVTPDAGGWVALRLAQPGGNRFAVGARIELEAGGRTWFREVQVGGGHAGGQAGHAHFGLGSAEEVRARVRWPDGEIGPWRALGPGRFWLLERGMEPVAEAAAR
ncbi:FG-GAP repeat domain protein [Oceanicola granulosus HTCC2516]|uniref:FG-GAP repeat domain protein n=1 Tax=Oceanicola granulosus (strain ATCC BAA-861 / DSM 15982 / KCTC 12143 / HTCC2516) TaxID=314256 RepID=Q2CFE9_OCEGH|nr:CRTAC1 family protein [Oceanicola granulosus]EAR51346.1 FG-GAP repeat domain protein [Oceanicola granulosus HTCC2516]